MIIRQAQITDSADIARLSSQLGYETLESEVEERLAYLLGDDDHAVFVMEGESSRIMGWVHVHGRHLIESQSFAEIGGLVVDERDRRKGIGKQLMRECEEWARTKGYEEVRLRSSGLRKDAHEFYKRIGYINVKWQEVFEVKVN